MNCEGLLMNDEQIVAFSILHYLVKQPRAKDTLQGISEWWILKEQIFQSVEGVSKALDLLISKGFVVIIEYENQEKYYQLNEAKFPEIKKILDELR